MPCVRDCICSGTCQGNQRGLPLGLVWQQESYLFCAQAVEGSSNFKLSALAVQFPGVRQPPGVMVVGSRGQLWGPSLCLCWDRQVHAGMLSSAGHVSAFTWP